jgi:hypothetical protein
MRQKKDPEVLKHMCARFVAILDQTGLPDSRVSKFLGYTGQGTLSSVRRGKAFPDTERLATFGTLVVRGAGRPNLHWILTGAGPLFLGENIDVAATSALGMTALLGPTELPHRRPAKHAGGTRGPSPPTVHKKPNERGGRP